MTKLKKYISWHTLCFSIYKSKKTLKICETANDVRSDRIHFTFGAVNNPIRSVQVETDDVYKFEC